MKKAHFVLACVMLGLTAANFVLALVDLTVRKD